LGVAQAGERAGGGREGDAVDGEGSGAGERFGEAEGLVFVPWLAIAKDPAAARLPGLGRRRGLRAGACRFHSGRA
jgi:hypothetical protein